jgi:hypothetical protein
MEFFNSIVLEVVLYPIFLKLIYIVSVSKFFFNFFINSGGILSEEATFKNFSFLIIVRISLYFVDDTSYLSLKLLVIEIDVLF